MTQTQHFSRLWLAATTVAVAGLLAACDRAPEGGTNVTPPATSAPSTPALAPPPVADTPAAGSPGAAGMPMPDASSPSMGSSAIAPPAMGASEPARQP